MAGDSSNSLSSPEERLKALISCPLSTSKLGIEHESAEGEFQENQPPVDDNPSSICVICFSDYGKAERGKLDSCDHYFCFVCIMEWARIESRCPACKGRFTAVHRIPKDGCRIRERIVNIPMRNQDQSAIGNNTNGPHDPYAETYCTVCKGVEDEGLMLLCDLCDSAAHTYCVGLGASVPEGDWFCHDCTLSRTQHADAEMDTASGNDQNQIATVEAHISISDIVKESSVETVGISSRRALLHSNREPPSIVPSWRSSAAQKSFPNRGGKGAGTSARTLHRCRNIHGHIRALRENWSALRRGSLSFPSSSSSYGGNSSKQVVGAALNNNQTGQPHFPTAKSFQQASGPESNESSYDVEKAWRMMEIAKAKAIHEGDQTLRYPARTQISIEVKDSHTAKGQQLKIKKLQELAKDKKEMGKYRSPELDKQLCRPVAIKKNKASNEIFPTSSSSCRGDSSAYENGRKPSNKIAVDEVSSSSRTTRASEKGHAARGTQSNNHDAKTEIRTLVKINLKLLSRDKNLGYEGYKEVARVATHSIMGACGLEPPPKCSKRFSSFTVCSHTADARQLQRSTLMPDSCRECFLVFVKDVVNTLMSEKLGASRSRD